MLFLLTNDDGIDAPGLAALRSALPSSARVVIAAPSRPASQCGHRVTTHEPLEVEEREPGRFAVAGTPADCVRLALRALLPEPPRAVLSGINHGGNLGADLFISGTLAAAREAAYLGVPAIAFSHYLRRDVPVDWDWATRQVAVLVRRFLDETVLPGEYWNANLPHLDPDRLSDPEIRFCDPCNRPLPVAFRRTGDGRYHYCGDYSLRDRRPGSDVDLCFGGQIAVSRLRLD